MLKFFSSAFAFFCFLYGMEVEDSEDENRQLTYSPSEFDIDAFDDSSLASWLLPMEEAQRQKDSHAPSLGMQVQSEQKQNVNDVSLPQEEQQEQNTSSVIAQSVSSDDQEAPTLVSTEKKAKRSRMQWDQEEHRQLKKLTTEAKKESKTINWENIASHFSNKDAVACLHRYYYKLYPKELKRKHQKKRKK